MIPVIIESPYSGNVERNMQYLRRCIKDCLDRGEAPFASHLMYMSVLNDMIPEQRSMGINAGLAWGERANKTVVYTDYDISIGMHHGINHAVSHKRSIEFRSIGKNDHEHDREDAPADVENSRLVSVEEVIQFSPGEESKQLSMEIDDSDQRPVSEFVQEWSDRVLDYSKLVHNSVYQPEPISKFMKNDYVKKVTGEYHICGTVLSVFSMLSGNIRIAVEHKAEGGGSFIHVYAESNLELVKRPPPSFPPVAKHPVDPVLRPLDNGKRDS